MGLKSKVQEGVIGRSMRAAVEKGQENVKRNVSVLEAQNKVIIENLNEVILLLKKVCDKLEIEAVVEQPD